MCGVLGLISREKCNLKNFTFALNTMVNRGPDAYGIKEFIINNTNIILGHRRLSVIDLSSLGNQPMTDNSDNFSIVFNGEIYNFLELKSDLERKGYKFTSRTDTEVLLNGYIEYRQGLVERIEGMFSFGIFDKKKNILTFARDHFGKKPFYYFFNEKYFIFSSELKAIIAFPEIRKLLNIDQTSIIKFLFYGYIPSPNSILTEIKKLEPSTTFQFDISNWIIVNKYRYWKVENIEINNSIKENVIIDKLDDLIFKSVKKRLISDVPLGIFLSGGIDSSLIAAYMRKITTNVNSFTVSYTDYDGDETKYAKRVSNYLGINSNFEYFEGNKILKYFFDIMNYMDEPMADPAIIPLYFISKMAKSKITVALSGDGGDELFGGYPKYQVQYYAEHLNYFKFIFKVLSMFCKKNSSIKKLFDGLQLPFYVRQFIYGSGSFLPDEILKLLNIDNLNLDDIFQDAYFYSNLFKQKNIINKSLYLDCKIQLPDWYLVKGDRATMAASLEMRNPLLDKELAEFVFSLDDKWKIKNGEYKYILKKIASKYLEKEIIYRKKKGFAIPLNDMINNELKYCISEYLYNLKIFNNKYISNIYNKHVCGQSDYQFKLLRIFTLNYYLKKEKFI